MKFKHLQEGGYWLREVQDLLDLEEGLNDWEVDFIKSINTQVKEGNGLNDNQIAKIDEIWDKHCG